MELDLTPIIVSAVVVIGLVFSSKIILTHVNSGSKPLKAKIKEMEDYQAYQKKMITTYKNKANNMERGPMFEGEVSGIDSMLGDIVSGLADYAPKWLQPLLKDPQSQKMVLDYVEKNPEKAKQFFGKMVGKKVTKKEDGSEEAIMSV